MNNNIRETETLATQHAASPAGRSLREVFAAADAAAASAAPTSQSDAIAVKPKPTCFVCCEPCVAGSTAGVRTREGAQAIVCRLTINGVRVPSGAPYTSVVRGTHYARPSAFDCHACGASVCCLCMCRRLLAGIQYVARHPLTCACGEVSLINERTVLFLTLEQEHLLYLRCDEWYCPDPLYCPVPTCSAYIPTLPCLMQFGKNKRANAATPVLLGPRVSCVRCDIPICTQCKGLADDEAHSDETVPCTRPNVHRNKEIEQVLWEKGYRKW